ncbi:MAG: PUA domain-containing protein [Candidatus Hermodarchaeota archaeon]
MEANLLIGLRQIKGISDYQFGKEITDILFDNIDQISFERSSKTNKIRYVFYNKHLLLILRPTNGFFTLTPFSAKKIIKNTKAPKQRVIVLNEISEFIKKGRNVFCKHVVDIDDDLRPLDEVIVVNQDDDLLGIGKLKVPVSYINDFSVGIAVNVRKGIYKSRI